MSRRSRGAGHLSVATVASTLAGPSLAVAVLAGCGTDPGRSDASSATTAPAPANGLPAYDAEQQLPPDDVGTLRHLYDPALQTLGVHMTRAALIDISGSQYVPSSQGRHLALYVEPTGDYSTQDYVDGFWRIAAMMTPDVFARWPQLESYDICQEPLPSVDDSPEPFPVTQINITRDAAASIDWQDGDLVDLLTASRTNPDVQIVVNRTVRTEPSYAAADAAAKTKARANSPGAPTSAPN